MRPRSQFALVFIALVALSAPPAWKLATRFDARIQAYEQQKQVDLKRPLLEQLQETLREAHRAAAAAMPASATTVGGEFLAIDSDTLAGLQETGALVPVFLSGFDATGCIHLVAQFERLAPSAEAIHLLHFIPPQAPPEPLSRALGNAVRGLDGYSLTSYESQATDGQFGDDRDSARRYGAWLWDRRHRFGLALEVPAETIDAQVDRDGARFRRGRRFLAFLGVASYLMILAAFARLAQRGLARPKSGSSSCPPR